MKRQHLTRELSVSDLRSELGYIAEYLSSNGHNTGLVLFGFAWGNDYYETSSWEEETIPLTELSAKVKTVESQDIGSLGSDDLFLKVGGIEVHFCHHSDIHLSFESPDTVTEHFFDRWKSQGFEPVEWLTNETGKHKKVRE